MITLPCFRHSKFSYLEVFGIQCHFRVFSSEISPGEG